MIDIIDNGISLGGGFYACCIGIEYETISAEERAFMQENDMLPPAKSHTWVLAKGNQEIAQKTADVDHPLKDSDPGSLIDFFEKEIFIKLGCNRERFDWMRRKAAPRPSDIPPWKRTEKARVVNVARHTFTDDGNAFRFVDECRGWIIFDKYSHQWFAWEENHWEPAEEKVVLAARYVARSISEEGEVWSAHADNVVREFEKHAKKSADKRGIDAMLELAKSELSVDLFECETTYLLACKNCVIDTRTTRKYQPWEYESLRFKYPVAYVDCKYIEHTRARKWMDELKLLMTDDSLPEPERSARAERMRDYLMRILGYGLYAGNPSRKTIIFEGSGMNGKSIIIDILAKIMGDQLQKASLSQMYSGSCDRASPTFVDGLPARFMICSEADGESGRLSSSLLKDITSGEAYTVKVRKMKANNKKTKLICLPVLVTNSLPQFDKELKKAELDRLITIKFPHEFTEENSTIKSELLRESDEIFSMMVDYLEKYVQEDKEKFPKLPAFACEEHIKFISGPELWEFYTQNYERVDDERYFVSRKDLADKYMAYADANMIPYKDKMVRDAHGQVVAKTLDIADARRLYNAARYFGYVEGRMHNDRGFRYMHAR